MIIGFNRLKSDFNTIYFNGEQNYVNTLDSLINVICLISIWVETLFM